MSLFHEVYEDTPENRERLFQEMLKYDEPFVTSGTKRQGFPFFLGVTTRLGKLAFMTGPDAKDFFRFVIAQWTPRHGVKRVDLPIAEIRWVGHV